MQNSVNKFKTAIESNYKQFMGTRVFVEHNSRKKLPHLRPDEPVPFWKVLKNLIG